MEAEYNDWFISLEVPVVFLEGALSIIWNAIKSTGLSQF
jgi:hypothetical protein